MGSEHSALARLKPSRRQTASRAPVFVGRMSRSAVEAAPLLGDRRAGRDQRPRDTPAAARGRTHRCPVRPAVIGRRGASRSPTGALAVLPRGYTAPPDRSAAHARPIPRPRPRADVGRARGPGHEFLPQLADHGLGRPLLRGARSRCPQPRSAGSGPRGSGTGRGAGRARAHRDRRRSRPPCAKRGHPPATPAAGPDAARGTIPPSRARSRAAPSRRARTSSSPSSPSSSRSSSRGPGRARTRPSAARSRPRRARSPSPPRSGRRSGKANACSPRSPQRSIIRLRIANAAKSDTCCAVIDVTRLSNGSGASGGRNPSSRSAELADDRLRRRPRAERLERELGAEQLLDHAPDTRVERLDVHPARRRLDPHLAAVPPPGAAHPRARGWRGRPRTRGSAPSRARSRRAQGSAAATSSSDSNGS